MYAIESNVKESGSERREMLGSVPLAADALVEEMRGTSVTAAVQSCGTAAAVAGAGEGAAARRGMAAAALVAEQEEEEGDVVFCETEAIGEDLLFQGFRHPNKSGRSTLTYTARNSPSSSAHNLI